MIFWGGMDLLYIGIYVVTSLIKGKIPFYTDVLGSVGTSQIYGSYFPLTMAILEGVFYLSLLFSGALLIAGSRWGRYLCYVQIVPRAVFIVPSLFPLIYVFRWIGVFWVAETILVLGEALKFYSMAYRTVSLKRVG